MPLISVHQPADLDPDEALELLSSGEVTDLHGLLPWGSNHTFLVSVCSNNALGYAIYKPRLGERPLWDFPEGTLCLRERAAYLLSEMLEWGIVPPTVIRDGAHGLGSLQWYIPHDPEDNYFTFGPSLFTQLRRIALFDHIINNADRKGGHCLLDASGKLWAIDHGVCFHAQPKIRTVIWDFAGEQISPVLVEDLGMLCGKLTDGENSKLLRQLLSQFEVEALLRRTRKLEQTRTFPEPGPGRSYPWPPV
jgi:uncharacterized repeat protein (TIGR03843 family)